MEREPFASVILLNYNGMKHVETCMSSLLRTQYQNWELVFVDNGSTDGSGAAFVDAASAILGSRLTHVRVESNIGYSKANNLGLTRARGELIVLVSNDIEVKPDWLERAAEFFSDRRNSDIAVAEAYLISIKDRTTMDFMYNYIDPIGFCHPYRGDSEGIDVFYSEGAVMFLRREVLRLTQGLFDGDYFMFFEDIDFCWRVRLAGHRVAVIPRAQAFHVRGGTVEGVIIKSDPRYLRLNTRNRLATLYKNYDRLHMILFLTLSLAAEFSFAVVALPRHGQWGKAVMAGMKDFVTELPMWRRKRRQVQQLRQVPDSKVMELMIPLSDALRTMISDWHTIKGGDDRGKDRASKEGV